MTSPQELYSMSTRIEGNPYPGRGVVLGKRDDSTLVQVYWIMGRSPNSRNRVFSQDKDKVYTEAADPSKLEDPSLIIYNALREHERKYIVTNGDQTDTVFDSLCDNKTFRDALLTREHEPDAPNYTPRISGMFDLSGEGTNQGKVTAQLAVIRKTPLEADLSEHRFYEYDFSKDCYNGSGLCITTYLGDGKPLPSFQGDPFYVPISGTQEQIADFFWDKLDADNKVSLCVKTIDISTKETIVVLRNKYEKAHVLN